MLLLRKITVLAIAICLLVSLGVLGSAGAATTEVSFCEKCHAPAPPPPDPVIEPLPELTCSTCHTSGSETPAANQIPLNQLHLAPVDTIPFNAVHLTPLDTCSECHTTDSSDTPIPVDTAHIKPFNYCSSCHTTDSGSGATPIPVDTDHYILGDPLCEFCVPQLAPLDTCADCHIPVSGPSTITQIPVNTKHLRPLETTCTDCHNAASTSTSSIPLDTVHLNPFDSTTCTECHNSGSQGNIILLPVESSCGDCHNTPASSDLSIQTSIEKELYLPGKTVTYLFKISNPGKIPLNNVIVLADACSPLRTGGDTNGDNLLDPGEIWIFGCTFLPTWQTTNPVINSAHVTGGYMGTMHITAEGEASLYPFTLGTNVNDYSGDDIPWAGSFTVKISRYNPDTGTYAYLNSFSLSESAPLNLWLNEGKYKFEETNLPQGFLPVMPLEITIPGASYPFTATITNTVWYGCTPGYWKNHGDSWQPTGYTTTSLVSNSFSHAEPYGTKTLLQALNFKGGNSLNGAKEILLRAGTAGQLNEAAFGNDYPTYLSVTALDTAVSDALSKDRTTMLTLATSLDKGNNGYCPKS